MSSRYILCLLWRNLCRCSKWTYMDFYGCHDGFCYYAWCFSCKVEYPSLLYFITVYYTRHYLSLLYFHRLIPREDTIDIDNTYTYRYVCEMMKSTDGDLQRAKFSVWGVYAISRFSTKRTVYSDTATLLTANGLI